MMGLRQFVGQKLRRILIKWTEHQGAAGGRSGKIALSLFKGLAGLPLIGSYGQELAGVMYLASGRPSQAIPCFEAALANGQSRNVGLYHHLGLARLRAKDPNGALPNFRRAVELLPEEHWTIGSLAKCLLALNQPVDAEAILRKGLQSNPGNPSLIYQFAATQIRQARYGEAIDDLIEKADTVDPASGPLQVPFPCFLYFPEMATLQRAEALGVIVDRHPQAEDAMIFLARMEFSLGRYQESTARLRQANQRRWVKVTGLNHADFTSPSFLIIGQAKAGTSALYTYLRTHPNVEPPLVKEPQFWSLHYAAGLDWYYAHFPPLRLDSGRVSGEGSVTYFHHPEAPGRIAKELPGVKLILLLRDPVSRAYSHYWMHTRWGYETRNWEDVVDEDLAEWPNCPLDPSDLEAGRPLSVYLLQSAALPHLKRWLSHFPHEQLLILRTPELARDFSATLGRVCAFLELPPFVPRNARRVNEGHYPPMAPEIEQRLHAWFAPHQQALERFLKDIKDVQP